jgi:alpha-galactosidase
VQIDVGASGITLQSADGRVRLDRLRPSVEFGFAGGAVWSPTDFEVIGDAIVAQEGRRGLRLRLSASVVEGQVELRVALSNAGSAAIVIERLVVCGTDQVHVGDNATRWRTYRNGYQSWGGTMTIGVDEQDRDVPTRFGRGGVTDRRHRSPSTKGHVRSDWYSAICEPASGDALGIAFTTMDLAFGFVELEHPSDGRSRLEVWADLDGTELVAGASTPELAVRLHAVTALPAAGGVALRSVVDAAGRAMSARSVDRPHPGGWCSWYYYFTKVTEADVVDNLAVLAEDGRDGPVFGCEYVMVDDGHQLAIGDWLDTDRIKFPSGMAGLADQITRRGFDAGIWWAPFIVSSRSDVAREHPEWLVRTPRGRPLVGLVNPGWGITNRMWVLDTTHPAVLDHIASTAATIGEWGYRVQKLDFLFAASLLGIRHDRGATRAVALRRGLEAVRRGAGESSFLLGCGCPLGPAVGVVDAMRIGADVTPYWSNVIDRTVGRGLHVLSTRNAVRNTLTRAVLDRSWWLNDPDCLMVRDTDTKLTLDEVRVLCTVFGMTNGMVVLSDRLDQVPGDRRELVARARELSGGEVDVVDVFERELPELLVSRRPHRTDVGVLNLGDQPKRVSVDLGRLGLVAPEGVDLAEYWTGRAVPVRNGIADLGEAPPHSAHVLVGLTFPGDSKVGPSRSPA